MTDSKRTNIMKSIKSVSQLEKQVTSALWRRGHRFRRNNKKLFGTPDISNQKYKIVIFIDSCFWHFCPEHGRIPKVNTEYWEGKYLKNTERDKKVNAYYKEKGWNIMRVWEHDLKRDFDSTILQIEEFIINAKSEQNLKY